MVIIVNNLCGGDRTLATVDKQDEEKFNYFILKPGNNRLSKDKWDEIKNHEAVKEWLKSSQITYTEDTDYVDEDLDLKEIDLEKAKGFIGLANGKDDLKTYALEFGYTLKANKSIDNMYKDLEEMVKG